MTANGIDLFYEYQTVTDPAAIAASGVQFAYCKISDGHSGNVDENAAATQGDGLRGAGIAVGYYHFAQPGSPAVAQAQAFAAILARHDHDLIPMVDVEQTAAGVDYGAWTKAFIDAYRAASGRSRILVYSSLSWFTSGQLPPAAFVDANDRDVLLWAARYRIPASPNGLGWSHPDLELYQWSDSGSVPGISSQVDLDVDLAPLSELMEDDMNITDSYTSDWGETATVGEWISYADKFAQQAATGVAALTTLVQNALGKEEADLLAAIKAIPAAAVDTTALAGAIVSAGLPQDVVTALLAVLSKAAAA